MAVSYTLTIARESVLTVCQQSMVGLSAEHGGSVRGYEPESVPQRVDRAVEGRHTLHQARQSQEGKGG